jgi:hypothetical protein
MDRRLLYCYVCARTEEKTADEVSAYTEATWPRCCGERMLYYIQNPFPAASTDTPPDMPAHRPTAG